MLLPNLILTAAALMLTWPSLPQSQDGPRRELFGVRLRPRAVRLLGQVERKFGRKVREAPASALNPLLFAQATRDPDGTPVIEVRRGVTPTEVMIVHELFHHKYGTATFEFRFYAGWGSTSDVAFVQFLLDHVYSSIQHWMFFPEIRGMGLNPDGEVRFGIEKLLEWDKFTADVAGVRPLEARAAIYFKAAMNIDDPALLARFARWYESKGWGEALAVAGRLIRVVREARPKTIEEAARVFVRCLAHFQREDAKFVFAGRTAKRIGSYDQPWYVVDVVR